GAGQAVAEAARAVALRPRPEDLEPADPGRPGRRRPAPERDRPGRRPAPPPAAEAPADPEPGPLERESGRGAGPHPHRRPALPPGLPALGTVAPQRLEDVLED